MMAGRPSSYKPEYAEQAYKLTLLGADDAGLADFFGVTEQTVNNWKDKHPEFFESLTRGKDWADAEVAHSFRKRALGYQYDEVHQEATEDGELRVKRRITKDVPPDAGAALNWLKNRQKGKWRDKQDHELTGKDGGPIETESMSDREFARALAFYLTKGAECPEDK